MLARIAPRSIARSLRSFSVATPRLAVCCSPSAPGTSAHLLYRLQGGDPAGDKSGMDRRQKSFEGELARLTL